MWRKARGRHHVEQINHQISFLIHCLLVLFFLLPFSLTDHSITSSPNPDPFSGFNPCFPFLSFLAKITGSYGPSSKIPYDYTGEVRNRFKGLDLIDRVPDELWMEVHDIVQETGIKTIPQKINAKKAKWLSEEVLQIAVKRREAKRKGEKERYKHLNAEFQRIARRDKKAFVSDQYKEIEENNRMGNRDLFKKIRDTKGTFHAKMG